MIRTLRTRGTLIHGMRCLNRRFSGKYPAHQVVGLPALSPTMEAGTLSKWLVKEGDSVAPGDAIAEIETDKASMAFEATDDLYIAKILVAEGVEVSVGAPILVTVESEADVAVFSDFSADMVSAAPPSVAESGSSSSSTDSGNSGMIVEESTASGSSSQRLSPAASHIAKSQRISVANLVGTSRGGLISKSDLILAIKAGTAIPGSASSMSEETSASVGVAETHIDVESLSIGAPVNDKFIDIPNTNMRKVIAKRLTESKSTVPHLYAQIECRLDNLLSMRKTFANDLNTNVSVNDMVIKAAALALRDLPDVRRKWDVRSNSLTGPDSVDIAVAVATPNGLITPIVTGADRRGCADINATVKDLAGRAKENKLMPEEYQGGSFSISNLGMFGIASFSAVINPPQACILAVGAGIQRMIPPTGDSTEPSVGTFLNVQLSADRRVVDEALAATFLEVFESYLSNPKNLLL